MEKLASVSTQTTQANISATILKQHEILIPPFPEQQKIASILTSVDEVIEKTQTQINKLQDLKKGTMNNISIQSDVLHVLKLFIFFSKVIDSSALCEFRNLFFNVILLFI